MTRKLDIQSLRDNEGLVAQLLSLLASSYVDPQPLLARELDRNTSVYLALDPRGQISAFFFVAWHHPAHLLPLTPVYMGLSACREQDKGAGATIRLYRQFILDAIAWETASRKRLLLWATTAHPLIFLVIHRLFCNVSPSLTGTFSADAQQLAATIRDQVYGRSERSENPFVIKHLCPDTRYSEGESRRCESSRLKLNPDVFTTFDIQEARGDRLLVLGELATKSRKSRET